MIRVIFKNHQEFAALQETVQLFSPNYEREYDGYSCTVYCLIDDKYAGAEIISAMTSSTSVNTEARITTYIRVRQGSTWQRAYEVAEDVPAAALRRGLKRQLYQAFVVVTGLAWPWGSLTGVRPTQIAYKSWERLRDPQKTVAHLRDTYFLTADKAKKAVEVAAQEAALLSRLAPESYLVYVGIPFCPSRCSYCSFISQDAYRHKDRLHEYVLALCQEIRETFRSWDLRVSSLYVGGGTPTSLEVPDLELLMRCLQQAIPRLAEAEVTVEAGRPDTISKAKLQLLRAYGVKRICINPQTMHAHTLERIGRHHDVESVYESLALARTCGFDDINMDLILGLPGENKADFLYSVQELISLGADSITLHTLALKRGARWGGQTAPAQLSSLLLPQADLTQTLAEAEEVLRAHTYQPYYLYRQKQVCGGLENTSFARSGKACLYNVGMMSDQRQVIGLGSGSASKRIRNARLERLYNSKDIGDYCRRIEEIVARKRAFLLE